MLVQGWFDYLHKFWPDIGHAGLVIEFLCVEYGPKNHHSTKKLRNLVETIQSEQRWGEFVRVLTPFKEVTRSEVFDWVSSISTDYHQYLLPGAAEDAARRKFPQSGRQWKLKEAYPILLEVLAEAYVRPATRFGY
jgi:hypothetical protein